MKINALKYEWQEYTCYIGIINYIDVLNLINVDSDLSMNREINSSNVKEIIKYIKSELEGSFFPPVILSCNVQTEFDSNQLKILDGQLTIIDGQHRIKAIGEIIEESEGDKRQKLNKVVLPVLIIEGLESSKHRELFNMINDNAKTVDSNISVRFSSTLENILGLKYVKMKGIKSEIEWEVKQSKSKVVYLHIVESIKDLTSTLSEFTESLYSQETLLYDQEDYYLVIESFLDSIFEYILKERELDNPKENLFKKKVFIRAVTDEVCEKLKLFLQREDEKDLGLIKALIEETLSTLLKEFVISYRGVKTVKESTYISIRKFLRVNSTLTEYTHEELEPILPIITRFVEQYYNRENEFTYSQDEFNNIEKFIKDVNEHKEEVIKLDQSSLSITKDTLIDELLELQREEQVEDEVTN
ncbi:DNA sulfur modification protein DndB [Bacillus salitolerans]|uniref:DNA sulfur modification protein DndB n=1 Tax=Bacillus salitolerans TaxID=1437434 RepID=A0ABW4LWG3_9BACI